MKVRSIMNCVQLLLCVWSAHTARIWQILLDFFYDFGEGILVNFVHQIEHKMANSFYWHFLFYIYLYAFQ